MAATLEHAIEPAEKSALLRVMTLGNRFEQGGAQCRRKNQRHTHRQRHRRNNRDRELAIDDADGAAEERHGHEHRREHERNADERAGDLAHGLDGRFPGREAFLRHDALDIFDDDDGVVHEQTDGEHHAEHGQRVDRETKRGEHPEGAEQDDGHGDGGNQCSPEILQEQIHDEEDQCDGFDQSLDHVFNGEPHERRGVQRVLHFDARRKKRGQLRQARSHGGDGVERIGAGGEFDGEGGARLAIEVSHRFITLAAEFNAGDVA